MSLEETVRALDHLVLPFADLRQARDAFERIGFTVAPEALHPFGTANACVFFGTGPYLEPLAVGDAASYAIAARKGHAFVALDAGWRATEPLPGLSALAIASGDAEGDAARLGVSGRDDPRYVEFSRLFRDPGGTVRELSFRLAFADPPQVPAPAIFFCEAVHREGPDRSSLATHANGARALAEVVLRADDPDGVRTELARRIGDAPQTGTLDLANAKLTVDRPEFVEARFGCSADCVLVFSVRDLEHAAKTAQLKTHAGLAVAPLSDGLAIAFREEPS